MAYIHHIRIQTHSATFKRLLFIAFLTPLHTWAPHVATDLARNNSPQAQILHPQLQHHKDWKKGTGTQCMVKIMNGSVCSCIHVCIYNMYMLPYLYVYIHTCMHYMFSLPIYIHIYIILL